MNNRLFIVFVIITFLIGASLGYLFSWHPEIKPHKILFVIGCLYNLLAVIVLSEIFTTIKRYKELSLEFIAPFVLWIHTLIPLGATVGSLASGFLMKAPGNRIAFRFFWSFFLYSLIPLGLLDSIVVFPRRKLFADKESRFRYFGLFLLISGVLLQLIASIMDLRY
jgi:hypothetical protein